MQHGDAALPYADIPGFGTDWRPSDVWQLTADNWVSDGEWRVMTGDEWMYPISRLCMEGACILTSHFAWFEERQLTGVGSGGCFRLSVRSMERGEERGGEGERWRMLFIYICSRNIAHLTSKKKKTKEKGKLRRYKAIIIDMVILRLRLKLR